MFKFRTILSPVILVFMLTNTYRFATSGTEVIFNPSNDPVIVNSYSERSTNQLEVPGPPSPSTTVKCVSMPGVLGSITACPNTSQIPAIFNSDPGESTNQVEMPSVPSPSTPVECIYLPDVVGSVLACPNPSQIPAPEWWIRAQSASNH